MTHSIVTCTECRDHYWLKWSRIPVKAKNRLKRLQARIKAWEEAIKDRNAADADYFQRSTTKPGSLKK